MTFQKGEKWQGNSTGRPTGTGHRQQLFKILVEPHKEALFDTAIKLALSGNEGMLRLFLERMLPPKPADDTVILDLPKGNIKKADTYTLLADGIDLKHLNDNETVATKVEQARDLHISRLIALHRGIAAFCSQVGLNSDDFLKTIHVRDVCFDIEIYLALEIEVSESDIQHAKELFLEYWHF